MAYLVHHHGALWFQIRVPRPLTARHGQLVRQNLQTTDRALAQVLAFQLAGQWLARFAAERMLTVDGTCPRATPTPLMPAQPYFEPTAVEHQQPGPSRSGRRSTAEAKMCLSSVQSNAQSDLEVVESLDDALKYWRKLNPGVRTSTSKEFQTCVKEFVKVVRKRPADLQRSDIAIYRDKLIGAGLARATIGKKVGFISTLLQTAYDAGLIPQNAARGMRIPKPKVQEIKRRAFTAHELRSIFASPVYAKKFRPSAAGGEAAAWVPMIALATGARLEEICARKVSDLYVDHEHNLLMRISDDDEGQSVKTVSSRRTVPLHPDLISAGLMNYWELMRDAEEVWLFPELEPDHDGRRGGNWGKWFARYLRSQQGCGISDHQVVFHSLRHTFKTLCRDAGLSEEVHDALTGHVGQSVGRSYGHMPEAVLVRAVRRIRFPVKLPHIEY